METLQSQSLVNNQMENKMFKKVTVCPVMDLKQLRSRNLDQFQPKLESHKHLKLMTNDSSNHKLNLVKFNFTQGDSTSHRNQDKDNHNPLMTQPYNVKKPHRQRFFPTSLNLENPNAFTKKIGIVANSTAIPTETPKNASHILNSNYYDDIFEKYKYLNKNIKNKATNTTEPVQIVKQSPLYTLLDIKDKNATKNSGNPIRLKKKKKAAETNCTVARKESKSDLLSLIKDKSIETKPVSPKENKHMFDILKELESAPQAFHCPNPELEIDNSSSKDQSNFQGNSCSKDVETKFKLAEVLKTSSLKAKFYNQDLPSIYASSHHYNEDQQRLQGANNKHDAISQLINLSESGERQSKSTFTYKKKYGRIFCCF